MRISKRWATPPCREQRVLQPLLRDLTKLEELGIRAVNPSFSMVDTPDISVSYPSMAKLLAKNVEGKEVVEYSLSNKE